MSIALTRSATGRRLDWNNGPHLKSPRACARGHSAILPGRLTISGVRQILRTLAPSVGSIPRMIIGLLRRFSTSVLPIGRRRRRLNDTPQRTSRQDGKIPQAASPPCRPLTTMRHMGGQHSGSPGRAFGVALHGCYGHPERTSGHTGLRGSV